MNEVLFRQLLESYILGNISLSDKQVFISCLKDKKYKKMLEEALEHQWNTSSSEETVHKQIGDEIAKNVLRKIRQGALVRRIIKYSSVAAVFIVILFASLLSKKGNPEMDLANNTLDDVIAPSIVSGGYGATLSLADGSIIVLDSVMENKTILEQNAQITKQGNRLIYNISGVPQGVVYNTISTAKGQTFEVQLSDGTRIWLNASSSIKFPTSFTGNSRRVGVEGEVYFEVSKNAAMPFIVEAKNSITEVLGTHFNVNAYDEDKVVKTTLLEGSVKISSKNTYNKSGVILQVGQQGAVAESGEVMNRGMVNTDAVIAWKEGKFYFNSTDLKSVMNQLSRWYNIEVVYETNKSPHFNGQLDRNTQISKILHQLSLTGEVHFKINENKITVTD